jgi:hypothetical protein
VKGNAVAGGDAISEILLDKVSPSGKLPIIFLCGKASCPSPAIIHPPAMLSLFNEKMQTVIEPGNFRIMIGSSSKDIRLREVVRVW